MPARQPPHRLVDGPARAATTLILAHGAGSGMDSEFMQFFADTLAAAGIRVVRFEFPYMQVQRETGKKRPPDRGPVLQESWLDEIEAFRARQLFIGGKSMGGRVASLLADATPVAGLICLGYPFHPVGKPDKRRTEHLETLQCPTLIVQGERDPFGKRSEVEAYPLSSHIEVEWLPDGDHSFKPRKQSGISWEQNLQAAAQAIQSFIKR